MSYVEEGTEVEVAYLEMVLQNCLEVEAYTAARVEFGTAKLNYLENWANEPRAERKKEEEEKAQKELEILQNKVKIAKKKCDDLNLFYHDLIQGVKANISKCLEKTAEQIEEMKKQEAEKKDLMERMRKLEIQLKELEKGACDFEG